ncbi:unnamed protein product, partial [Discosporangium mesarthrocarpum]
MERNLYRVVTLCSHLFWVPEEVPNGCRDARRVLECLQRSLKIADVCLSGGMNALLFTEILNHYVYYFEAGNQEITDRYISGLVALINELKGSSDFPPDAREEVDAFLSNTVDHIRWKQSE